MSFWTEQDVLECIYRYKIPYPSVYGNIIQDKKEYGIQQDIAEQGVCFVHMVAILKRNLTDSRC